MTSLALLGQRPRSPPHRHRRLGLPPSLWHSRRNTASRSSPLDSVRSLIFGSHLGTHNHIIMMTQHFAQHEHDVDKASLERQDRQNFLGPVKLSGVKVSACVEDMQNGGQAVR